MLKQPRLTLPFAPALLSNVEQNTLFGCCVYFVSINMLNRLMKVLLSVQLQRFNGDCSHSDEVHEDGDLAGLSDSAEISMKTSVWATATSDLY